MKMHYIATVLGNNEPQLQKNMGLSESAAPALGRGPGPRSCSEIWAESAPWEAGGQMDLTSSCRPKPFHPGHMQVHGACFHRAGQP